MRWRREGRSRPKIASYCRVDECRWSRSAKGADLSPRNFSRYSTTPRLQRDEESSQIAERFARIRPGATGLSPRLLLIESSTHTTIAAARRDDGGLFEAPVAPAQRHASGLLPAIEQALAAAGMGLHAIEAIAVGVGPGSFTGLRVGLTAAKVLCHVRRCPLIAVDSMSILARGLPGALELAVVVDAQRGSWYAAQYRRPRPGTDPMPLGELSMIGQAEFVARLPAGTTLAGPGLERLSDATRLPAGVVLGAPDSWIPKARALAECADQAWRLGQFADPRTLEPLYIRASAAEEKQAGGHSDERSPRMADG